MPASSSGSLQLEFHGCCNDVPIIRSQSPASSVEVSIVTHGALSDLRVLDLTQMLAGPLCTQFLADQGATVIKVESPGGDGIRHAGPFRPDDEMRAFGGYFASVNRNKLSLSLDLKDERGKAVLRRLAAGCDVLVENFRAGVMERLGLAYEVLREDNPALVYAAIRGFGDPRTGES
ncbi:MAG: CoA transferase, partial [Burkholderiales bacterium]|nr:CoA transferase [Burkholderiales bacterium]